MASSKGLVAGSAVGKRYIRHFAIAGNRRREFPEIVVPVQRSSKYFTRASDWSLALRKAKAVAPRRRCALLCNQVVILAAVE
jgi:hypothetical protein